MRSLIYKEFTSILSNWAGVIGVSTFYLLACLVLWLFSDSSYLAYGYADPDLFFNLSAWLLLFILPVLTINFFSEEFKSGTIEILHNLPVSITAIISSKYIAGLVYNLLLILGSIGFIWVLDQVGGNIPIDTRAMLGSYIGLILFSSCYIAISLFASVLTHEIAISFIIAIVLGFIFYSGFSYVADMPFWSEDIAFLIKNLGFSERALELSKGILPLSTVVYLISITLMFLLGTYLMLTHKMKNL